MLELHTAHAYLFWAKQAVFDGSVTVCRQAQYPVEVHSCTVG